MNHLMEWYYLCINSVGKKQDVNQIKSSYLITTSLEIQESENHVITTGMQSEKSRTWKTRWNKCSDFFNTLQWKIKERSKGKKCRFRELNDTTRCVGLAWILIQKKKTVKQTYKRNNKNFIYIYDIYIKYKHYIYF